MKEHGTKSHYVVRHMANGKRHVVDKMHGGFIGAIISAIPAVIGVGNLIANIIDKIIKKKHGKGVYSLYDPHSKRTLNLSKHKIPKTHKEGQILKGLSQKDAMKINSIKNMLMGTKVHHRGVQMHKKKTKGGKVPLDKPVDEIRSSLGGMSIMYE